VKDQHGEKTTTWKAMDYLKAEQIEYTENNVIDDRRTCTVPPSIALGPFLGVECVGAL
jgi:hypothetical protein